MLKGASCEQCFFFEKKNEEVGECRKLPPRWIEMEAWNERKPDSVFPLVSVKWWCGEFSLRKDEEVNVKFESVDASPPDPPVREVTKP